MVFSEGWIGFYKVTVAIVKLYEKRINDSTYEEIMLLMFNILKGNIFMMSKSDLEDSCIDDKYSKSDWSRSESYVESSQKNTNSAKKKSSNNIDGLTENDVNIPQAQMAISETNSKDASEVVIETEGWVKPPESESSKNKNSPENYKKHQNKGSISSDNSTFGGDLLEVSGFSIMREKDLNLNDEKLYKINIKKESKRLRIDQKTIDNKLMEYQYVFSKIEEFWEEYGKIKGENLQMY